MKYTLMTEGRDHVVRVSHTEDTKFYARIRRDVRKGIIADFRQALSWQRRASAFSRYHLIPRVCLGTLLRRQDNGALVMERCNGLVVLDLKPLVGTEAQEDAKRRAMSLPTTVAAFVGASGRSVKVVVRVAGPEGHLPQHEAEAERFYAQAHAELLPVYGALLAPHPIVPDCRGMRHAFLMPWDEQPRVNPGAVPFCVGEGRRAPSQESDWTAFALYDREYKAAERATREELGMGGGEVWNEGFLSRLSGRLRDAGVPSEEAFEHMARHLHFWGDGITRERLHTLVDEAYDARQEPAEPTRKGAQPLSGETMRGVIRLLEQRYEFRHNIIMGYTEYRHRTTNYSAWKPVTDRVINELTMELMVADVPAWNRDVKRYVESYHVPDYDIVEEYLLGLGGKWDGRDHIRQLARTVPTRTREWPEWFHRFFLGMVAQWQHRNTRYGNAIVPLLVSRQGFHKSDFCRQLLPPELRSWGYTDSLSLAEQRPVLQAMTQMLLICLDEFNQIPARKQEGFLKNIITLPSVKVKRPYARHVEELPRLASFIATTNQPDALADTSGSRRFVGILIESDIDTSQRPNYEQLFAQAVCELDKGERYWFDERETEAVMQHNRRFQAQSEVMAFFLEYFEPARSETEGQWMTAANLLSEVKRLARGLIAVAPSVNKFARELHALPGILTKSTPSNNFYLVRRIG